MELFTKFNNIDIEFTHIKNGKEYVLEETEFSNRFLTCPFCSEVIKDGELFVLYNDRKLFPNIVVHKKCLEKYSTKEEAMLFLIEDYKEALKRQHWFNID